MIKFWIDLDRVPLNIQFDKVFNNDGSVSLELRWFDNRYNLSDIKVDVNLLTQGYEI